MGRPALDMIATVVRFRREALDRIDNIVGQKGRAKFIREAVNKELERRVEPPTQDEAGSARRPLL